MNYVAIRETAVRIAREAGELLLDGFQQEKRIERKSTVVDWVTQYDTAAEELIAGRLLDEFPDHGLVGEEGSTREGDGRYTWYVDPLDGTTNFAHGFPVFCVSLALYAGDTPLVGVVHDPGRDECFSAVRDHGAILAHGGQARVLQVSKTEMLRESLLATGFPYDRQTNSDNNVRETAAFLRVAQGIRRPGSAALDLAYVAAGRLDGYWEYGLFSWDMAAGRLLVEEAGGLVTTTEGGPVVMTRKHALVVSNGRIHQDMLAVLARVRQAARDA